MFTSSTKLFQGITPATSAAAYQISRSLRFNSADSAYLNRTPTANGNRKTWTWSGWLKRSALGTEQKPIAWGTPTTSEGGLSFRTDNAFEFYQFATTYTMQLISTQVFRDPGSFFHLLIAVDTTQSTASDRVKIYQNGIQITQFSTATYPAQNLDTYANSTSFAGYIGVLSGQTNYFGGYMTEINFIDGQALTPSSFGQTDSATGVWSPIAYTGTYGTNGFYLNFSDNSGTTSTTLGKDYSGNGNNWTPNNFSVTAGAGNDSLVDSPTNYGTDTGVGGEVRGNYATINPIMTLQFSQTYSNGNLECTGNYAYVNAQSTICVSSGKWYAEAVFNVKNSAGNLTVGAFNKNVTNYIGNSAGENGSVGYWTDGTKSINGTVTSYGATYGVNDVIGVAMDVTGNSITFYKNGVSQGAISYTFDSSGAWGFLTSGGGSFASGDKVTWNFGQRPFAYPAPSGFKVLCTTNLPIPTVGATSTTLADDYFNIALYTGTGANLSVTGLGFQPDFVWIKGRSGATDHGLYDAVRGVQKQIESNTTTAETTETTGLTAFGTDGFTVGTLAQLNTNTATYVGWAWKANGAGVSNTAGSITSTVSANQTAGISVVTYTIPSASATIETFGHGLGRAPSMVILKVRGNVDEWTVYNANLTTPLSNWLTLNTTAAAGGATSTFSSSSTTFGVRGTRLLGSGTSGNIVAYCFAEIEGFSKFGSYTGNGSSDGPFVYTGFRPRYILIKNTTTAGTFWNIVDTARAPYNVTNNLLFPNASDAETTNTLYNLDILSNGFKVRNSNNTHNTNGDTYIFMAFAESPFNYSRAR